jgi:hypothetical protein
MEARFQWPRCRRIGSAHAAPRSAAPADAADSRTHPATSARRRGSAPPLILGHASARQRAISASSGSAARPAGRCGLQPSRPSSRHTCPGWSRTPGSRSITAAIRPRVHSSVSNPNAAGPLPNASATPSSSAADSRGRRPARPAARSAASPPWPQWRYQTLAAWADTPTVRATSAWVAPWVNMWAASSRRASRPTTSRRQVPVLIGIATASECAASPCTSSMPVSIRPINLFREPL